MLLLTIIGLYRGPMEDFVIKGWHVLASAIGLAFYCGILTQRVKGLENWRLEIRQDVNGIFKQLRHIESLIKKGAEEEE